MINYCPKCQREALPDEVSERGRHELCGAQVRRVDAEIRPEPTWWERHGADVLLCLVGIGLVVVIVVNMRGE